MGKERSYLKINEKIAKEKSPNFVAALLVFS
jgi:hypothetical protein